MQTVYVLTQCEQYEGSSVVAVYLDKEKAEAEAARLLDLQDSDPETCDDFYWIVFSKPLVS